MQGDTVKKTFIVAFCLCLFCSVLVSGSAILLREKQAENKKLDIKKNLLIASGLIDNSTVTKSEVEQKFKQVKTLVVDLKTSEVLTDVKADSIDMRKNAKDPSKNIVLSSENDLAKISTISQLSKIYLIKNNQNEVEKIVLPVHGKGLWSTLYGFLALDRDKKTIKGLGFYEHAETPGLGGEVDNPKWKKGWVNKIGYDSNGEPQIKIVKGSVDPKAKGSEKMIDGLSGATITANGVQALVNFWLGSQGYGNIIKNLNVEGAI
ncbi:MAG: Na(+)-translocating NADH-quinone reductase subunit C [Halobacteriovoraceae bacterium]|nr:Na(+)-translocating NADH-quinone reductase subunit C [Halobacteriovoraceae bacterium]